MQPVRFNRTDLFDLIWDRPLSAICLEFGMTRAELQKACAALGIPLPENGHWSKLKFGKAQPKPVLADDYDGPDSYTFGEVAVTTDGESELSSELADINELEAEIRKTMQRSLIVPDRLVKPLPVILKAQTSLGVRKSPDWEFDVRSTGREEVDIKVTPAHVNRALRFMDTLLKCMFIQGFQIENGEKGYTYGKKERVKFRICFREKTKRVEREGERTLYEPVGELYFKMDGFGGGIWKDGGRALEEQVLDIVVQMQLRVNYLHRQWKQNRLRDEKQAQQQAVREEAKKEQRANEQAEQQVREREEKENDDQHKRNVALIAENFKPGGAPVQSVIQQEAERWKTAELIREYAAVAVAKGVRSADWAALVLAEADRIDPLILKD